MLAYLIMFTALFNADFLYNDCLFLFYFALDFSIFIYIIVFCFHILSLSYWDVVCLFHLLFCIMCSAFNQLVFIKKKEKRCERKIWKTSILNAL